ncbi:MAG: sugar ABC transporter permease [Paracoccaceae bacterium]|jgi:multiple sugar transport system permease protein|nr:sugar ABC transporter permease [Paracoccaceae bacterium]
MANTEAGAPVARAGGAAPSSRRRQLSEAQAAAVLLLPFLAIYALFLVYPFFRGFWISLHDWNLLEVAFNPDAKQFVGLRNYERVMWGRNIEWGAMASPVLQALGLAGVALGAALGWLGKVSRATAIAIAVAAGLLFLLTGFQPGEEGRWYDRRFWPTVANTIVFVGLTVPGVTLTALVLAAAMNRETKAMGVLRTLFFLSQVLSVTVVTLIWQIMFSPRQGLIANVTQAFGGTPINWLTDEQFAMAAIVIATIWWSLGIAMILFLAGLQDISRDLYEAAALDNATGTKAFRHITLPNLKRTITLVIILQIILHFQVFGQSHLMTQGGPNDETQVLVRYIYQTGFRDSELGRASAMAVFLFVVMGAFSVLQFVVGREEE